MAALRSLVRTLLFLKLDPWSKQQTDLPVVLQATASKCEWEARVAIQRSSPTRPRRLSPPL
jgi:hypothetical protein